ncbi:MAG TPA: KGK domain-containing protein [Leptolyngbyaceae cyanobacterium]
MSGNFDFVGLAPFNVVSIEKDKNPMQLETFKVREMSEYLGQRLQTLGIDPDVTNSWSSEGVPCEVLRSDGRGWQKGKVRFSLEFIPDPPETESEKAEEKLPATAVSPLDDLRTELNLSNE